MSLKTVKKGTILQMSGELPTLFFKVVKGLLRSYTIDEKGKEHIFAFGPEGWIIGDVNAFMKNNKTELFIQAIEDTIYETRFIDLDALHGVPSKDQAIEIKLLMNRVAVLQRRVIMLISNTALERYEHFIETYPGLIHRVPQRMIASYLGITPEALSKIRSQKARKS